MGRRREREGLVDVLVDAPWQMSAVLAVVAFPFSIREISGRRSAAVPPPKPDAWTIDALRTLEWKRLEMLCHAYYRAIGFRAEMLAAGADGGVDVRLFKAAITAPVAVVQCKAWARQLGVAVVRELCGVMAHEGVRRGIEMVRRLSGRGDFWGCRNFPGCRTTMSVAERSTVNATGVGSVDMANRPRSGKMHRIL